MPAGSTRRVPTVSSGALYLRSTPRTRSSVAFGTPADGALADGTPADGALPGRVAALARAEVTDPRPYRKGTAARLPRTWRRLTLPPLTPSAPSVRSPSAWSRLPLLRFTTQPGLGVAW